MSENGERIEWPPGGAAERARERRSCKNCNAATRRLFAGRIQLAVIGERRTHGDEENLMDRLVDAFHARTAAHPAPRHCRTSAISRCFSHFAQDRRGRAL